MARFRAGQFVRIVATGEVGRIEGISEIGPRAVLYNVEFQGGSGNSKWIAEAAVEPFVSPTGADRDQRPRESVTEPGL
jgi:hypothetical protein